MSELRRVVRREATVRQPMVIAMAASHDASILALGWYEHPRAGVELVEIAGDRALWNQSWLYSTADYIDGLAFSPDGARVWVAMSDGRLRCHARADGALLRETRPLVADSVLNVHLSPDASYAVSRGVAERNPTGWYAVASDFEDVVELVAAEALRPPKEEYDARVAEVRRSSPGRNTLLRFGGEATLAYSRDGALELRANATEDAPCATVRTRDAAHHARDTMKLPPKEIPLSGAFTDDGRRYFVGTRAGRVYGGDVP